MIAIYRLFMRHSLRTAMLYVSASTVALYLITRVFLTEHVGTFLAVVCLMAVGGTCMFLPLPTGANLSWLQDLPISKRRFILFHGLLSVSNLVITGVSVAVTFLTIDFALNGRFLLARAAWARLAQHSEGPPFLFDETPLFVWILLGIAAGILFDPGLRTNPFLPHNRVARQPVTPRRIIAFLAAVPVGILVLYLLRDYIFRHFPMMAAAALGFPSMLVGAWQQMLPLSPRATRRAWAPILALTFVVIAANWIWSYRHVRGPSEERATAAMRYLGPYAGTVPRARLEMLLASATQAESARALADEYRNRFNAGQKFAVGDPNFISLDRVIAAKADAAALERALSLFRPESFTLASLSRVLGRLDDFSYDRWYTFHLLIDLQTAAISRADLEVLAASSSPMTNFYALLRMRYLAQPGLAEIIVANLPHYRSDIAFHAINTLSILARHTVTLAKPRERGDEPNCDADHPPTDTGAVHYCLRRGIDPKNTEAVFRVENIGWVMTPYDGGEEKSVRDLMRR